MFNVIVTDNAFEQLVDVNRYLSESSIEIANRIVDEIADFAIERLSNFPYSGARLFENPNYRNIFKHSHRIIYKIIENEVHILAIIHTHQDIENIIETLEPFQ